MLLITPFHPVASQNASSENYTVDEPDLKHLQQRRCKRFSTAKDNASICSATQHEKIVLTLVSLCRKLPCRRACVPFSHLSAFMRQDGIMFYNYVEPQHLTYSVCGGIFNRLHANRLLCLWSELGLLHRGVLILKHVNRLTSFMAE